MALDRVPAGTARREDRHSKGDSSFRGAVKRHAEY